MEPHSHDFANQRCGRANVLTLATPRFPAHEVLEIDANSRRVRKHAPPSLDLSGIAKGYGVDRLAEVIGAFAIPGALVGIDGELRAP
jgi:thiamine biosynthesis lipoprotein